MTTTCTIPGCSKVFIIKGSSSLLEHLFCWHIGSNEAVRCDDCGYGAKWLTSDFRNHFRSQHDGVMTINDRRHLFSIKASELLRDYYPEYLDQCQETIRKWKATAESIDAQDAEADSGSSRTVRVKDERLSAAEQKSKSSDTKKRRNSKRSASDAADQTAYMKCDCFYCGMNVSRQNFARHAFSKHSDVPAYQCPYCDFRNNCGQTIVSNHVQAKHPDQPMKVINNRELSEQLVDRCFPDRPVLAESSRRRSATAKRNIVPPSSPREPEMVAPDRPSHSRASTAPLRDRQSVANNKLLDCRKCGAQVQDTVADKVDHFFREHGQGKAKRYQCPYCSDGDRDIENTMNVHIQLKHPGRRVVSIDRADKDKYRQMIDELFEPLDNAKRARMSTPMVDQMLMSGNRRSVLRGPSANDDVVTVYEKRSEPTATQRPMFSFGNSLDNSQFNMQQAMMPMLGNGGMGGMMMPFMPGMMQQLQNQNMTMVMMPMIVPLDYMKQMNQMMLTNGAFGQNA